MAEGRQEVEDCRNSVGFSVDDIRRTFYALGLGLFPWPFLEVFSCLKKFQALFQRLWLLRWALHSRNLFAARWFLGRPGFCFGTAWSYEKFAHVRLRQQL